MPFDGSGNYVPPSAPTFPAVPGTTIVAAYYNAVVNDMVTALNNCITRDGQGKPSASISWNGQNLTNVGSITTNANITVGGFCLVNGVFTAVGLGTFDAGIAVTGVAAVGTLTTTVPVATNYGGTGVDAHLAANGSILIGNGAGFALNTLTAGAGIAIDNTTAGHITISATGGGGSGTTSFSLTFDNSGAGISSGGTFNGASAKTVSWNTIGAMPQAPRVQAVTSAATVTPTLSNDLVIIAAQAVNLTIGAVVGTPADGSGIVIRIKDNGTARTITWNALYRPIGVTLPTTTIAGKTLYVGMLANSEDSCYDVVSVIQQ